MAWPTDTKFRITEEAVDWGYAYLWDDSLANYTNRSAAAKDYDATSSTELFTGNNDALYIGSTTKFYSVGFRMHTALTSSTLTWQYWNGSTWATLVHGNDTINDFTTDGFLSWPEPTTWTLTNSGSNPPADLPITGYWIRALLSAGYSGPSCKMYHLCKNITLQPPLKSKLIFPPAVIRDVNNDVQKADLSSYDPIGIEIGCRAKATNDGAASNGWPNMMLLHHWNNIKRRVYIEDVASSALDTLTSQGYYKTFSGIIFGGYEHIHAPWKIDVRNGYNILVWLDTVTKVTM